MTRITFYQAGAWHEFHQAKNNWVDIEPAVVIIPEHENKQIVVKAFPYLNTDAIFTIPELIARYIQSRGGKGLILPHVMESILGSIMTEVFVPHLKMENFRQSYIRALTDFICNFRNTSLLDLETALADFKAESLSFKEKDLIKIYSEYESRLPDYGFDLRSGLVKFLSHTDSDNIYRHLGIDANQSIIFLGFNYLSPLEEEFIFTLFRHVHRAHFLFCADLAASEQSMRIQKSIASLLKRSRHLGAQHKILPLPQQDFFINLSRSIFKADLPVSAIKASKADSQEKVVISQANSRFQEVVSIARQIRQLMEIDVAPNKIRVVAPAYTLYSAIIEEVFLQYQLAFSLEQGVPLMKFPLANLILHLVNQGVNHNPYPLREKILSSQYVSFSEEVLAQDLAKFQQNIGVQLLTQEKLTMLLEPGSYQLDNNFLKNIRREAYRTVKPVPGIPQLEVIKRYINGLNWDSIAAREGHSCQCLIQFYLLALVEKTLSSWQAKMSGNEFKEVLQKMLHRFHIEDNIEISDAASAMLKIQERDRAVLKEFYLLLEEMTLSLAATGQSPTEKIALSELVRIFSRLMDQASLSEASAPSEAVGVITQSVNRGQYEKWDYTFICGMVDGEFPATDSFNFLQPKKEGLALGQAYTSVDHGRSHLYHLVRSSTNALFLSRPLSDNGKRLPPSPFIREIEKCIPAKHSNSDSEPTETDACLDKLYSQREKLLFIGKNADHHYEKARPLLKELKHQDEMFFKLVTEIMRFDGLTLNDTRLSEFDGLFCQEPPTPAPPTQAPLTILADVVRNLTFTPAVLERYAACPLRFFFDDILGLKLGPDYDPDTSETGVLVRSILKEYTAKACAAQSVPDDAPLFFLAAVEQHLKERELEGVDAFHVRFLKGLAAGLDQQEVRRRGLLHAFLQYEKNGPDFLSSYLPQLAGVVTLDDQLEVQVEIDRVDLAGTTDYLLPFLYTIADTGDPAKIRRGLRFDLPLVILLCMNYVAEKQLNLSVAGAGLYQVKTAKTLKRSGYFAIDHIRAKRQDNTSPAQPVFSGQREGFMGEEEFTQALAKCQDHISLLHRLMQKGVFHLPLCSTKEQSCSNCSFGRLCRKDQLRLEKLKNSVTDDALNDEKIYLVRDIF